MRRRKALLVFLHEWITLVLQPSFLLMAVGFPLLSTAYFAFASNLAGSVAHSSTNLTDVVTELTQPEKRAASAEGFVDHSGLIQTIPEPISPDTLRAYPSEEAAQQALARAEITAYYVVPKDYLASGELIYVTPDFSPLLIFTRGSTLRRMLQVNLLGGDTHLTNQVRRPLELEITVLEPSSGRNLDDPLAMFLPYAVMMIFYFNILMSSSLLLSGLRSELYNRVLEVLLSSLSARQLLAGKIFGLGSIGLLQTGLWAGVGFVLLRLSGRTMDVSQEFMLPPSFLGWGAAYFLFGYALYASLMAGVGVLVSNLREASTTSALVSLPLMACGMMFMNFILDPNGALATGLSLFPLTSPVGMMMRLAAADHVPFWQILLSLGLLALTTVLVVFIVAKAFRAQRLLSERQSGFKSWLQGRRQT